MKKDFVTKKEALEILDVKAATLYSYVSRGMIRKIPGEGKMSLYRLSDVERQLAKKNARRGHKVSAASALNWGEPVLVTALTDISPQGPLYRGILFSEFIRKHYSFERVAEYLWYGLGGDPDYSWKEPSLDLKVEPEHVDSHCIAQKVLINYYRQNSEQGEHALDDTIQIARSLIGTLAHVLSGNSHTGAHGQSIAEILAKGFRKKSSQEELYLLNAALVTALDHEITASTFSARIAASTGASLSSCLVAAVATHSGSSHGTASSQLEHLLETPFTKKTLEQHLAKKQSLPGFGHPLYPEGDPRGSTLIDLALQVNKSRLQKLIAIKHLIEDRTREKANFDFGLLCISKALGTPIGTPSKLFLLGRIAGLVAHIVEQRQSNLMIRPRGRYIGNTSRHIDSFHGG